MALNLYLDDCANSDLLTALLTQAGNTVIRPADVGLTGEDDDIHLGHAVQHGLIVVTKDPDDFHALHLQNPNHPGIFALYQDNDIDRDLSNADVVAAIGKIEAAVAEEGTGFVWSSLQAIVVRSITYRKIPVQYRLHLQLLPGYVTGHIKGFVVKEKFDLLNRGIVNCCL